MKTLILSAITAAAVLSFTACTTVESQPDPTLRSTTTTTESNTVHQPFGTTETRTTRSY